MKPESVDVVVIGAGPAGAAAALGLAALGHSLVLIAPPSARDRAQRESFSARTVEALRSLGVDAALAAVAAPGERSVRWAGEERTLPGEAQVERAAFDAGLLADLARRGVRVWRDEVVSLAHVAEGARVALASGAALEPRLVVEARGRAAPSGGARERGVETLCLLQRWHAGASDHARIAISSLANGWAWVADDGRGGLTSQLALDVRESPARGQLAAHNARTLHADPWLRELLCAATPVGAPLARAATPVLDGALASGAVLRVGDAACAVDPLSGNGVFQALSSALVAPAVVNTLLRRPERAALARAFHAERVRDAFLRFARVSRDFYAQGAAFHGGAFWTARAGWPDDEPAGAAVLHAVASRAAGERAHTRLRATAPEIALRPVVCDGWIEQREVVLTPERPLGIWRIAGVEIAPLVRAAAHGAAAEARALAALPEPARAPVRAWLHAHRPAAPRRTPPEPPEGGV